MYILLRFRNVAYSVGATVALAVDTILIIGAYSLCYGWVPFSLEIDQTFIGAILTAIGYSINDKVVIFDRGYFANQWVSAVNQDFYLILYISSFLIFFALWISYGRIELTLMSFLPMLVSWIIIVGLMGIARY